MCSLENEMNKSCHQTAQLALMGINSKVESERGAGWGSCWFDGCFGFNGPLRQYFSIGPSPKEREKEERKDT